MGLLLTPEAAGDGSSAEVLASNVGDPDAPLGFLALVWPSPGHFTHLESESANERPLIMCCNVSELVKHCQRSNFVRLLQKVHGKTIKRWVYFDAKMGRDILPL